MSCICGDPLCSKYPRELIQQAVITPEEVWPQYSQTEPLVHLIAGHVQYLLFPAQWGEKELYFAEGPLTDEQLMRWWRWWPGRNLLHRILSTGFSPAVLMRRQIFFREGKLGEELLKGFDGTWYSTVDWKPLLEQPTSAVSESVV
jgi:hypothetical protein